MPVRWRLIVAVLSCMAAGCDATSPRVADGPWSTGHEILGAGEIGMELNLAWSSLTVEGTGSYAAAAGTNCGSTTFSASGTLKMFAQRPSATEIRGYMQFASDAPLLYSGSVTSNEIDGSLIGADGTQCPLTLFSGLVP